MDDRRLFGRERTVVDPIVPLAGVMGLRHPKMRGVGLHWNESRAHWADCSDSLMNEPRNGGPTELHEGSVHRKLVSMIDSFYLTLTKLGTQFSYGSFGDINDVAEGVKELGWRLVGQGYDDGSGGWVGGPQVSNLFQNPSNLDCVVTFQGSSSIGDWLANANFGTRSFCGRRERVHGGFRNHMRRITRQESWQTEVRAHLPRCGKVYVTGHSLGGAMAELFTACAESDGASEDYSFISWVKGTPARLPYL